MALDRELFINIVKDAYSAYYTISEPSEEDVDLPMAFRAVYDARDERYFVTKSAKIWANEKIEYAYVFSAPSFNVELAGRCMDHALADMLPRVKPHKQHQYTNCKVILIADSLGKEVIDLVKKRSFSKSYGFLSMHGYSELLAAAVDLKREKTFTNRVGSGLNKFFDKLFALRREA